MVNQNVNFKYIFSIPEYWTLTHAHFNNGNCSNTNMRHNVFLCTVYTVYYLPRSICVDILVLFVDTFFCTLDVLSWSAGSGLRPINFSLISSSYVMSDPFSIICLLHSGSGLYCYLLYIMLYVFLESNASLLNAIFLNATDGLSETN